MCPCGSSEAYEQCCQKYHLGEALPEKPEQLMRARYSAFVMQEIDFLIDTLYPDNRTSTLRSELQQTFVTTQWLKLEVIKAQGNRVHFIAHYKDKSQHQGQLEEVSRFQRKQGRWYYRDGVFPTNRR